MATKRLELLAGERQAGESARAVQACNDYLRMGPARSLRRLVQSYKKRQKTAPTRSLDTVERWSVRYGWQVRSEEYDAALDAEKTRQANEIMQSGLALVHERVQELKRLATWLKGIQAGGEKAEDEEGKEGRFSEAAVRQLRGVLDDLAKETGGRRQGLEIGIRDIDTAIELELARLAKGQQGADAGATTS